MDESKQIRSPGPIEEVSGENVFCVGFASTSLQFAALQSERGIAKETQNKKKMQGILEGKTSQNKTKNIRKNEKKSKKTKAKTHTSHNQENTHHHVPGQKLQNLLSNIYPIPIPISGG
jgi:predicted alpha/beta superfamily hydrolase